MAEPNEAARDQEARSSAEHSSGSQAISATSQPTSTTHTMPSSKFPFSYLKIHPQLYIPKEPNFFVQYVLTPINIVIMPIFGLLRLLLLLLFLSLNSITVALIDLGTDRSLPQTPGRKRFVMVTNRFYCSLALFFAGFICIKKDKSAPGDFKKSRALVQVSNHRGILDSLAMGAAGVESILGSKAMTDNFITKYEMSACRGLETGSNCVKQLQDRYQSELDWPSLLMFPEGCTTPKGVVIRPKLGAFISGGPVEPVCLNYKSKFAVEWLTESIFELLFNILLTFCMPCEVTFLPIMEREKNETPEQFADRVCKAIADELNENFVPYTKNDVYYFMGKKGFTEETCTEEYIEDFGWMGNAEHYKSMCKSAHLNWRIEHEREEFIVNEKLLMSEHAPLIEEVQPE